MIQLYLWVSPKCCAIKRFEEIYCRWIKMLVQVNSCEHTDGLIHGNAVNEPFLNTHKPATIGY